MALDDADFERIGKLIDLALERRLAPIVAEIVSIKVDIADMKAKMSNMEARILEMQ